MTTTTISPKISPNNAETRATAMDTMERWYATVDASLLDENIEWTVPGYPVPRETYIGREAVFNDFFPAMSSSFSEFGAEKSRMIDGGEDVTVIGHYKGKTLSGKPVEIPFIHIWTVRNGLIVRVVAAAHTQLFVDAVK